MFVFGFVCSCISWLSFHFHVSCFIPFFVLLLCALFVVGCVFSFGCLSLFVFLCTALVLMSV